ncbi:predicted protein [Aspergillus terreus NIH2624]|uniref:Uncharacterized protein n=1 Tax=Aspergillus terreus (strain NIH 2624 / FGSC A1156) TaxID=341663 RepID=Q0CRB5_ASPTN|nr:uncharacterized protein ATEG_03769 [Aspergillus terreus NIH2624]EAU35571.1 predicted protein [Aspergillus terreus NIH2624]
MSSQAILAVPTASDSTEAQASNNSSDTLNSCQPSYKLLGEAQDRTVGMSRQEQGPAAGGILADQYPRTASKWESQSPWPSGPPTVPIPIPGAGKNGACSEGREVQGYLKLSKTDVWVRVMPTELHDVHQRWVRYNSSEYVDIVTDSRNSEYGVPILVHSKKLWNMPLGLARKRHLPSRYRAVAARVS